MNRILNHPSRTFRANGSRGFTLIELLVVIAIILIIVGLATFAIIPMITKAKLTRTINSIRMAESGMEKFVLEFPERRYGAQVRRGFPKNDEMALSGQPPRNDGEMLRIFILPSQVELDGMWANTKVTKSIVEFNDIKECLNNGELDDAGETFDDKSVFVDGWDQPLRYQFPGRNHALETNFKDMKGSNQLQQAKPDIWSIGEDGINFYDDGNVASWPGEVNDPTKGDAPNDDVTNWFPLDRY